MLYIIGILKQAIDKSKELVLYKAIDTLSESCIILNYTQLKHILRNCKIQVANVEIYNDTIKTHDWTNNITLKVEGTINQEFIAQFMSPTGLIMETCPFILLAADGNTYKVANYQGRIAKLSSDYFKELIYFKKVANCTSIDSREESRINGIDTYEILMDPKFEENIAIKYKAFESKATMLGYGNISFTYEIENHEVKLSKYTGSSRNIILPSFITAIMEKAFNNINIEALSLNEGLKVIGNSAFASKRESKKLNSITIPSTVELIGSDVFENNTSLINYEGNLKMSKIKLQNNNTVMLDGCDWEN